MLAAGCTIQYLDVTHWAVLLCRLSCPTGVIASYLHASPQAGLGKMGALVGVVRSRGEGVLEEAAARKAQVQP